MKPRYKSIDSKLEAICDQLFNRIHELAIKAMEKEPEMIQGFCMGMGSISFHCVYGEDWGDGDIMSRDEDNEPDEMLLLSDLKCRKEVEEIQFIIDEYNPMFKLTGQGLKLKWVNGKIATVYEW